MYLFLVNFNAQTNLARISSCVFFVHGRFWPTKVAPQSLVLVDSFLNPSSIRSWIVLKFLQWDLSHSPTLQEDARDKACNSDLSQFGKPSGLGPKSWVYRTMILGRLSESVHEEEEFFVHFPFKFQMVEAKLQMGQAPIARDICDVKRWKKDSNQASIRGACLPFCSIPLVHPCFVPSKPQMLKRFHTRLASFGSNLAWTAVSFLELQVAKWPLLIYLHGSAGGTFFSFCKREMRVEGRSCCEELLEIYWMSFCVDSCGQ